MQDKIDGLRRRVAEKDKVEKRRKAMAGDERTSREDEGRRRRGGGEDEKDDGGETATALRRPVKPYTLQVLKR